MSIPIINKKQVETIKNLLHEDKLDSILLRILSYFEGYVVMDFLSILTESLKDYTAAGADEDTAKLAMPLKHLITRIVEMIHEEKFQPLIRNEQYERTTLYSLILSEGINLMFAVIEVEKIDFAEINPGIDMVIAALNRLGKKRFSLHDSFDSLLRYVLEILRERI